MRGATDGGAHIEAMRTGRMRRGRCQLCGHGTERLERHHELYRPEHVIDLCHACHHRVHFRPYHLNDREKEKLLRCRHGDEKYRALAAKPRVFEMLKRRYVAPGRRPAQLEVRRRVRELAGSASRETPGKRKRL
jgi:hypothetical protein